MNEFENVTYIKMGILGINERNIDLIRKYNSRKAKRIADDKLLTKRILSEKGIKTPKLITVIPSLRKLEKFKFSRLPENIVVKPKRGFGGNGIMVFFSKDNDGNWLAADKTRYSPEDLKNHVKAILEGNFSLSDKPDVAFFEERVTVLPQLKNYVFRGVPDIRVIVFNKIPIMAMLRLPTKESNGKANLHAGGVGVGIDIATGITTYAIHHEKIILSHPDTSASLSGIKIPDWEEILEIAVRCQIATGLGYAGVDLVIDKIEGPLVLELNARPGLAIQLANMEGLKKRIERVAGLSVSSVRKAIQISKSLFEESEDNTAVTLGQDRHLNKKIVGCVEYAQVSTYSGTRVTLPARLDTGARRSSIDELLAAQLGFGNLINDFKKFKEANKDRLNSGESAKRIKLKALKLFDDYDDLHNIIVIKQANGYDLRPVIKLKVKLADVKIKATFTVTDRTHMKYPLIIGRLALRGKFVVDPSVKFTVPQAYNKSASFSENFSTDLNIKEVETNIVDYNGYSLKSFNPNTMTTSSIISK